MSDVTRILSQIESGDRTAADQLLPLIYDELRALAAAKLAQEKPGHTLQATALVHETYLRLVGDSRHKQWQSRGHFFGAAAEAMRRILVDAARRRHALKRGGGDRPLDIDPADSIVLDQTLDLLALDDALTKFAQREPLKAELVKLRFFAGLTMQQAAETLGISLATAERHWTFARTWLFAELSGENPADVNSSQNSAKK
jgi:RNA polymerase sigma factor (TIGR02999 family)